MGRISIKGVLVGSVVDVVSSVALGIPFAIYAALRMDMAHVPKDQIAAAAAAWMRGNIAVYIGQLLVGLGCSALGGYLAGRMAKHDELLNGALSSLLCIGIGIYSMCSGKESHSLLFQVALLIASPSFGLLGGYLSLLQRKRKPTLLAQV